MSREKIFVSYSHRDHAWLERLLEHLGALERWGLIHAWSDTQIEVGADWQSEIENALSQSKIAVLLISPAFLSSHYIWREEMHRILAHGKEGMEILPLISRPCAWRLEKTLSPLQGRPTGGRALSIGNDAQIDLDLSAFVYELAAILGQSTGNLAVKEREFADEYRARPGKGAPGIVPRSNWRGYSPFEASGASEKNMRPTSHSWTGVYNNDYPLKLTVYDWPSLEFEASIDYLGSGTVTQATGRLVEDAGEIATVRELLQTARGDISVDQVVIVFTETGYERRGRRRIDFDGEYRAIASKEFMVGAWFTDSRLVASFKLESD